MPVKKDDDLPLVEQLFEKRIIMIDKELTEETCSEWIGRITLLDLKSNKPIVMVVNSFGGYISPTLGLIDVMRNAKASIVTACSGAAFSGASLILAAGNKRYATPNSRIMIHQQWSDIGEVTHEKLVDEAEESKKVFENIVNIYHEFTGKPKEEIDKALHKDTFLSPQEAKDFNLIDDIAWNIENWLK